MDNNDIVRVTPAAIEDHKAPHYKGLYGFVLDVRYGVAQVFWAANDHSNKSYQRGFSSFWKVEELEVLKFSKATREAINKNTLNSCIEAWYMCEKQGEGAYNVALRLDLLDNTRVPSVPRANSCINAGRELVTGRR